MIAVVKLDNARYGAGPATVVEVTPSNTSIREIIGRYIDKDGGKPEGLRFWACDENTKVGDRVKARQY